MRAKQQQGKFINAAYDFNNIESQLQRTNAKYRANLKHHNEQLMEYKSFVKPTKHGPKIVYRGIPENDPALIVERLRMGTYPIRMNVGVNDRSFVSLFPIPEVTVYSVIFSYVDEDLKQELKDLSGINDDNELKKLIKVLDKKTKRGYKDAKNTIFPPNSIPNQTEYMEAGFSMSGVSSTDIPEVAFRFAKKNGCVLVGVIEESYPWYLIGGRFYESEILTMGH